MSQGLHMVLTALREVVGVRLKRAAVENAVLFGDKKLCNCAAFVSRRLGISCSSLLQTMRHYMVETADQDAAGLDDEMLRNMKVRCPSLQCCSPCHESTPALEALKVALHQAMF